MKRIFLTILALLLTVALLPACESTEDGSGEPTFEDGIDYDNETATEDGAFVGKDTIYQYRDTNLAVLKLENHSENNYDVTIHAQYLDEFDQVIGSESQTFRRFAAGWSNHFLFQPDMAFETFTYSIEITKTAQTCYAQYVDLTLNKLYVDQLGIKEQAALGDWSKYPTLLAHWNFKNNSDYPLNYVAFFLLIDQDGNVWTSDAVGTALEAWQDDYNSVILMQTTEDSFNIPPELTEKPGFICGCTELYYEGERIS